MGGPWALGTARYGEFMAADRDDARDNPVVLSRIYTRTGDGGTTALGDGSRVGKDDPRLAAYADVDEANCAIGTALALGQLDPGLAALLTRIQNELFDVGADLCNPISSDPIRRARWSAGRSAARGPRWAPTRTR